MIRAIITIIGIVLITAKVNRTVWEILTELEEEVGWIHTGPDPPTAPAVGIGVVVIMDHDS